MKMSEGEGGRERMMTARFTRGRVLMVFSVRFWSHSHVLFSSVPLFPFSRKKIVNFISRAWKTHEREKNNTKKAAQKRRSKSPKKFQHHTGKKCVAFWISLPRHHPHFRRFKSHFHDRFRVREGKSRKDECRIVLLTIWMSTKKLLKLLSQKSDGENPHVWPEKLWFCFQQGFFRWFKPCFLIKSIGRPNIKIFLIFI